MKDVAQLAGVSRTTVSFVLNGKPHSNIPEATQARIKDAVKQLGYRPNILAQGLRSSRTNTIGFISDEVATTPYAGQIILGAQEQAWQHNNLLLLINTGSDKAMKRVAVETLLDRRVDGIIYATMYHREVSPPDAIREVPTVLLDCFTAERSYPSVVPDEVNAAYDAVTYLLEKGHRRIGFIRVEPTIPASVGRLEGYQQALNDYDIPFDPKLVWAGGEGVQAGGYTGTMTLMQQENRPTAIFFFNDRMAMGGYDALRSLGLSIPSDVAIIGFDNQEIIAADIRPALTTMQLPHYEMGQWAIEHLLSLINNPATEKKKPAQQLITCPLIVRDSV